METTSLQERIETFINLGFEWKEREQLLVRDTVSIDKHSLSAWPEHSYASSVTYYKTMFLPPKETALNKIAVFGYEHEARSTRFLPASNYVFIHNVDSIRGRVFVGAIVLGGQWYNDRKKAEAFDEFKKKYPNLFK